VIVVDTNVLSELMRAAPEVRVVNWVRAHAQELAIPTIVIGELQYGVARLPTGRRRTSLEAALDSLIDQFATTLLAYNLEAARACGDLLAQAEAAGRPMSLADAQIAAIARVARARLATRNVGDFAHTGLTLIDPWRG